MKERPILMSAPMVRAILAGTKTQTRRVVKPQPDVAEWQAIQRMHGTGPDGSRHGDWREFRVVGEDWPDGPEDSIFCPYGAPGDRLWVRETWACFDERAMLHRRPDAIHYAASTSPQGDEIRKEFGVRWRPSIHMPRWACRITLEVISTSVERLQEISEADAVAEGIERTVTGEGWRRYDADTGQEAAGLHPCADPVSSYRSLWDSINGPDSWDANPWVWVLEFSCGELRP